MDVIKGQGQAAIAGMTWCHKVFKNTAERGQCSIGWFYGFKLHLIINDKGEILAFYEGIKSLPILESVKPESEVVTDLIEFLKKLRQREFYLL